MKGSFYQKIIALIVRKDGISMKKMLKSLFIYEDDPRSMIYHLTSLQANGYLEDISLLFLEEIESGERL